MKKITSTIMALAAIASPAAAQGVIDFESTDGYKAIGVYDVWEESPFRTGVLTGNVAITANPDKSIHEGTGEPANGSELVAGAQRSRFGSNRFGLRVDLNETFELTPTLKYVHVMIHKPKAGRVMLVGLGSRTERKGQNPYCEQFWTLSSTSVTPDEWCDAVFPVKGAGGIDIRSLVVVPDCESPHQLTEDFLFYIDDIEINNSSQPRVTNEYYLINGDKATTVITHNERYASAVSLNGSADGNQTITVNQQSDKLLYQNYLGSQLTARPGETLTPAVNYTGAWMHGFFYIDYNRNGRFDSDELVAHSNTSGSSWTIPSFTLPASTQPGLYRCRFKIDWESEDPAGNISAGNVITANGGVIVDVMLNVHGTTVTVNDFQLNGEVLAADGRKLNALQTPFGQEFGIKMNPENGFFHNGAVVKTGYNLDEEEAFDKFGNPQYFVTKVKASSFNDDGTCTLPAELMRGNVLINGVMLENGTMVEPENPYPLNFPDDLKISRTDRKLNSLTLTSSDNNPAVSIDCTDNTSNFVYVNKMDKVFTTSAGATVTSSVNYNGNAMHTYFFVDLDEDGAFSNTLNADGTPAAELLSYSHYSGKNSTGATQAAGIAPNVTFPFVIPAETPAGLYRCRFKIDWNNIDPAGQYSTASGATNQINDNGGYVVDFMIHVAPAAITLTAAETDHGHITLADGTVIDGETTVAPGNEIRIAATTTDGATIKTLNARRGYHFDLTATFMGNNYWSESTFSPEEADDFISLPASVADRHIMLTVTEFDTETSITEIDTESAPAVIYDLQGRRVTNPGTGIYVVNGTKRIIRR